MKTLKIGTKSQADKILVESLFVPVNGKTLTPQRFDRGKYKAETPFVGREVSVADDVFALWMETRRDSDGSYKALFCISQ